jgi:hypothetical protein
MPGPQFDELKLSVSLVDNASAQLKSIKQSLDDIGTHRHRRRPSYRAPLIGST